MKIKMKNYARHLWLSLLLLVGVAAIAVPGLNGTNETKAADLKISSVDELIAFRNEVNSGNNNYYGKTVELTADLNLGSIDNWVPIGNGAHGEFKATQVSFCGTFNGNGHTISNLKCSNPKYGGLFGSFYGNCNELILKDVNISSNHYAGGIVAHQGSEAGKIINNCKVIGGNITTAPELVNGSYDNGDKAGGILGYLTGKDQVTNCSVENVTIKGYRDLGGIVGIANGGTCKVSGCSVNDVTIIQDNINGYKAYAEVKDLAADIAGRIVAGATVSDNTSSNVTIKHINFGVAQIGETEYETISDAVAVANTGDMIKVVKAGEYKLPNLPKNVTIEGAVDGVVFKDIVANPTNENNIASIPNGATFKNVTWELGNIIYHGFTHAGTINMEDCTINGGLCSYGNMNFTNCKFEYNGNEYCMWVYGPGEVVYDQCTFTNNTKGKLLHLYCEGTDSQHKVTVKDCKFVNGGEESKAAINVKATSGSNALQYELHLEGNNTYEGNFPTAVGEQTNADKTWILSPLAQVDDRKVNPDKITVYENDVLIYPNYVAAIGDTKYTTLQGAFDAAETGQTVTLLKDYDASAENNGNYNNTNRNLWLAKGVTVNGNNHTLTVTNRGIGVKGESGNIDVVFKDITIKNVGNKDGRCVDTRGNLNSLTLNNATLTTAESSYTGYLQPLTIGGNQSTTTTVNITNSNIITVDNAKKGYAITTFNPVEMNIDGSTLKGWACLNIKGANDSFGSKGSTIIVTNSTLVSANGTPGDTNAYSLIKIEDDNINVNITGSTVNVNGEGNTQSIVSFLKTDLSSSSANCTVSMGDGNNVTLDGDYRYSSWEGETSKLVISGGTFNQPVPEQNCAEGMIPSDLGDGKYSVKVGSYAAKINEKKYETLEAAFAAATDGATITLLANSEGNGIIAPEGKFNTTGLTVNFNNFTYTITGPGLAGSTGTKTQAFQLLKDNKITFKNGAIVGNNADVKMMIQNYSDLTLDNMVLDATQGTNNIGYVLSTNNGNTVIKDTKITAKEGGKAFDADSGWGNYPSNSVELTGESVITGDIEVAFEKKTEGTPSVLKLTSGKLNGNIVLGANADECTVTKSDAFEATAPAGHKWVDNGDGTSTLKPCEYVAQYNNVKFETLQAALDAAEADNPQDIVIDLLGDATLDITAWSGTKNPLAIGTESTKSITINGNNHQLTFNNKDSDWNNIATMNDDVTKLILNNMAITNGGHNDGPWNRHDINFNCAVELNNVTSDKALAFKNDASLKNVTVTETGDVYAIWVQPNGQNISIDGLTINAANGRGIKIDDQYVDNPKKVTLGIANATFNTKNKSAILVKSAAETVINVGEGINIENVAKDKVNLVWVDEVRAEEFYKVTVNNATIMPESKETDYVACLMKGEQRWGFYKGTSALSKAIDKVEDGYSIKLFQTTTETVEVSKPLVITKNGFKADKVTAGEGFKKFETETEIVIKAFNPVCAIGDVKYESLQEAVNAAGTNAATITLLTDAATDGVITGNGVKVQAGQNITFDLNGLTYNIDKTVGSAGTETNGFQLLKGSTVKFTNGTLTSATAKILLQNYSDLTLDGVTVNAGSADYAVSNNFGSLTVTGETNINAKSGGCAFDLWYGMYDVYDDGISVVFDEKFTGSVTGKVEYGHDSRVTDENWREKTKLEIKAGKFDIVFVNSSTDALNGANISISGGIFAKKPAEEYCADGYIVTDNTDKETKDAYPFTVKSKEDAGIFELNDWEKPYPYLDYTEDKEAVSITYNRNFGNTNWQALFIPFDINDVSKLTDRYEFAKIHMVTLQNENHWTNGDRIEVYYTKITSGKIYANKPYLIKPKKTGVQSIVVENTTLRDTHGIEPMTTSTMAADYIFTGTYVGEKATSQNIFFAMGSGTINYCDDVDLGAYRWYIKPDPKGDNYAKPIIDFIESDSDATGISSVMTGDDSDIEGYYNINGVRSETLVRGINIIRYKNGSTRKVVIK